MSMICEVFSYHPERGFRYSQDLAALDDRDSQTVLWLDLETKDPAVLNEVAAKFGLHELTVEDFLSPGHFPKIEEFGNYLLLLFRGLKPDIMLEGEVTEEEEEESEGEQSAGRPLTHKVAVCVGDKFIITFRRREVGWLDAMARQVKSDPELLRRGPWAIAHRVIDVLTDRFLRALGVFNRAIEGMEEAALEKPDEFEMPMALDLKRKLVALRQMMRDQQAIIQRLANDPALVHGVHQRRYFKDIHDHTIEIINELDKDVDSITGLRDAYLTMINLRLGDTMRVLTVLTTIAAPLNILAGLYGMNFERMPLLHHQLGFWIVVTSMCVLVLSMLMFFKKKHWI